MDVEKVARKLEPLMPEEVQRWLRVRDVGGTRLRALVEKRIMSLAHRTFGDFRKKILLSLPPKSKAKGLIHLGTVLYDQEKWPFGISPSELLQNLAIFGRSGGGKTNAAFHVLLQLTQKKIPFLFLDWKRTGRHLLPLLKGKANIYTPGRPLSPFPFNPFIPPAGLEPNVYVNHVVDVMADAYTLGDGARSILQKALASCYRQGNESPTVSELLEEVERIPGKERVRGWKISAVRALESIQFAEMTAKDRVSQEGLVEKLLDQNTILELNGLSPSSKKFLIPIVCLWLYYVRLACPDREQLKLVILVEEAHHLLHTQHTSRESLTEMLLRQCREIGIGIIVVDQHPHLMSSAALGNTYTTICLNLKDPRDVNKAAGLCLVNDSEKHCFSRLPVGQGVVKLQDRWTSPVLVQFPLVEVRKGLVTDAVLEAFLRGSMTLSGLRQAVRQESGEKGRSRVEDIIDREGALTVVHDIIRHSDDGVDARYRRLGFSTDKGNRLKLELLDAGVIEEQVVRIGRTRRVLLRVTDDAKQQLGLDGNRTYGSLVHEFWKRYYARIFSEQGYVVELEAPRQHGRIDVLARKGSESVAIEVETGKSDVVRNVKNCLSSDFNKVIVVATSEEAVSRVEQQLAKTGLFIPSRIEIVLRDDFKLAA